MTLTQYRQQNAKLIKNSATPLLDVDCLLSMILEKDRTFLLSHGSEDVSIFLDEEKTKRFEKAILQRQEGLPIAYITNEKEFFGHKFYVDQSVLIPKPDTEILVEKAVQLILKNGCSRIADICTGSGCIAISIFYEIPKRKPETIDGMDFLFYATDISSPALEVAKKNADAILGKKSSIQFVECSLMDCIQDAGFDLIISNPPYVPARVTKELLKDGRSEPELALNGDCNYIDSSDKNYGDGLSLIRPLCNQAFGKLKAGGIFLCETGEYNNDAAIALCKDAGFTGVQSLFDLEGSKRAVLAEKP